MIKYNRFDILLISLNPTQGAEIQKTRPCVVISPNEMNYAIRTLIVAPMTSHIRSYPTRVPVTFNSKKGSIVIDQIRTIDQSRVIKKLGELNNQTAKRVTGILIEMFS